MYCTAGWVQTASRFLLTLSKVTGVSPCKCTDVHWLCLHSNYDTEVKVVITCYGYNFVQCNNNYRNDQFLSLLEYGNGKTIDSTIFVWTRARSPLFVSKINSLLLGNWATWIMVKWSERMLILFFPSDVFYGRRLCRIVGSLVTPAEARRMQYTVTLFNTVPKKDLKSK